MRKLGAGKLAALLVPILAVWVAPAQAQSQTQAQPQTYKPEPFMQGKLWDNWFGSSPPAEPEVKDVSNVAPERPAGADRVLQHDRVMRVYMRRQSVCLQLQTIAWETNDPSLDEEAQRLEEMAFSLYLSQCKKLNLGTGHVPGPERLEASKPVRNSAETLSRRAPASSPPGRSFDGPDEVEQAQQTSATREGQQ